MNILEGDKCWVQGRKRHYGVCTGLGRDGQLWFVHNTPSGGVEHTPIAAFAGGQPIHVEQRPAPGTEHIVVARALSLVGRQYNLLFLNCEHVANWAVTGKAESPQVQQRVLWTGVAGLFLAFLNENGTSVDRQGYRRETGGRFASRRWW
jgi:hypothetical protein